MSRKKLIKLIILLKILIVINCSYDLETIDKIFVEK